MAQRRRVVRTTNLFAQGATAEKPNEAVTSITVEEDVGAAEGASAEVSDENGASKPSDVSELAPSKPKRGRPPGSRTRTAVKVGKPLDAVDFAAFGALALEAMERGVTIEELIASYRTRIAVYERVFAKR